jgi:hypothetical protein
MWFVLGEIGNGVNIEEGGAGDVGDLEVAAEKKRRGRVFDGAKPSVVR